MKTIAMVFLMVSGLGCSTVNVVDKSQCDTYEDTRKNVTVHVCPQEPDRAYIQRH